MAPRRARSIRTGSRLELLGECGEDSGLAQWSQSFETPSERVLENLVRSFEPRAKAIVGYHGIPRQDADDLVQQTYLTYLQRRDDVRDPQAWLAGTLRNRCLMFWRSERRAWKRQVDECVLESWPSREPSPQENTTVRQDLGRIVARLPRRSRELIRLRFGAGYSHREVAELLGYRYSGIYTITKRCLAALARELEAAGYSEGAGRDSREVGEEISSDAKGATER